MEHDLQIGEELALELLEQDKPKTNADKLRELLDKAQAAIDLLQERKKK